jgi:hypothetical protein
MNDNVSSTSDIWLASILQYLGCELLLIELEDQRGTGFTFACPRLDFESYVEDYRAGRLALSDARSFVDAFNVLAKRVKDIRRKGEPSWASSAWVEGRAR